MSVSRVWSKLNVPLESPVILMPAVAPEPLAPDTETRWLKLYVPSAAVNKRPVPSEALMMPSSVFLSLKVAVPLWLAMSTAYPSPTRSWVIRPLNVTAAWPPLIRKAASEALSIVTSLKVNRPPASVTVFVMLMPVLTLAKLTRLLNE